MISHLDGNVCAVAPDGAVIEVGGVGIAVQCTPATLATLRPGERARVPTSLIVREDSLTLYGFADEDERAVFELLQTASGVGPRLALAMLAVHSPDGLRKAIATEDLGALTMVPGIGRKGAQRIVLELAGRLGPAGAGGGMAGDGGMGGASWGAAADAAAASGLARQGGWREQVETGLTGLGWPSREAQQAVDAVAQEVTAATPEGEPVDVAVALRAALTKLSRR
ncbi:MAG: Holliday junction branch migration protein RuvA [Micromonosporaceae bacterium]